MTAERLIGVTGALGERRELKSMERDLDPMHYTDLAYRKAKPMLSFTPGPLNHVRGWQGRLRRKLVQLFGGFPKERVPLGAKCLATEEFEGYTRETITFRSRPGMLVFGYLLLPRPRPADPLPAILCLHGHGRGVDDIVGIEEDGSQRKGYGGYQNDFALQCVHQGYAALAIEQFGFGHRRDERARKEGAGSSSCQPASGSAFLLGQTMIGWRVYDAIRALDYLQSRREVDPSRLADMGISGGGTTSFYLAAIDGRVKAAVISGYFNTYRDSIMAVPHCIDNYIPGILKYAEMYDIAGLIAPRALFAESGDKDGIFPYKATELAVKKARRVYEAFGCPRKLGLEVFQGEHSFHGKGAFSFLEKWL